MHVVIAQINNLSDVGTITISTDEYNANILQAVSSISVEKIAVRIGGTLTGVNGTLTAKINGNNITNGMVPITTSGSQAGSVFTITPTGNNTLSAGDTFELICGGESTGNVSALVRIVLKLDV